MRQVLLRSGVLLSCVSFAPAFAADLNISQTPVQVVGSVQPNVMILMDTSGSMRRDVNRPSKSHGNGGAHPNSRISHARRAAKRIIDTTPDVRFCLARLNGSHGGRIVAECGASTDQLKRAVDSLPAYGQTPVAEAYYEVTRYFRGWNGHFPHKNRYRRPITHSCQKNFAVVISDGNPTSDGNFSGLRDWQAGGRLPNWDRSDNDSGRYYLDDIAKFAWDIDLSFDHDDKQNLHTYTVGFNHDHDMLRRAARVGNGAYFRAGNETQLVDSLTNALKDIGQKSFSVASLGGNSSSLRTSGALYQARFNSSNWSGQLLAYGINNDPSSPNFGKVSPKPLWDAAEVMKSQSRYHRTLISSEEADNGKQSALVVRWDRLNDQQKRHIYDGNRGIAHYIRGNGRSQNLLGDIVNSSPVYVGSPARNFVSDPAYAAFKVKYAKRPAMVYVGANDGMLHGFTAEKGEEQLAYIPSELLGQIKQLADKNYRHRFWVDGTPTVADAVVGGQWRTMLVGGLGAGGKSIYALDVTDPNLFNDDRAGQVFKWEFKDSKDADLGYTFSRPNIVKLRDGKWYAVFGNGLNNTEADGSRSTTGEAVVYIVDLETGQLKKKLHSGAGLRQAPSGVTTPNGMTVVTPVTRRADGAVEYLYAGDIHGNLWKFDLNSPDPTKWRKAYKLFQACAFRDGSEGCNQYNYQPITARMTVTIDNKTKQPLIVFGTGTSFAVGDRNSKRLNTIYGVYDQGTYIPVNIGRRSFLQQSIESEVSRQLTDPNGQRFTRVSRITSNNKRSNSHKGWYMDLRLPGRNGAKGERVLSRAQIRGNQVFVPYDSFDDDPCKAGGGGGVMVLNAVTGARLNVVSLDQNKDGKLDDKDLLTDSKGKKVASSSIDTAGGGAPVITDDHIYIKPGGGGGGDGPTDIVKHSNADSYGRQRWRYFN